VDYGALLSSALGQYTKSKDAGVSANTQRDQIAANEKATLAAASNQRLLIVVGGAAVCLVALVVVLHR
jgi:hypothetical protein